jgi:hypothetical protein
MATSKSCSSRTRHELRRFLRLLKTPTLSGALALQKDNHHPENSHKRHFNPSQLYVLNQYRGSSIRGRAEAAAAAAAADPTGFAPQSLNVYYVKLLQDLAERARLLQLDTGVDQILTTMEASRRAAARVGFQLPQTTPTFEPKDST